MDADIISLAKDVRGSSRSLRSDNCIFDIRCSISVREHVSARDAYWYFSLYGDEIDERADKFFSTFDDGCEPSWGYLELTDAVLRIGSGATITVARGAAATFPLYWRPNITHLHFSTWLPVADGGQFSRDGLISAVAGAFLSSSYEINAFAQTPLAEWNRVRRGALTTFVGSALVSERIIRIDTGPLLNTRDAIAREIEAAFAAYSCSQRRVNNSVLELSGGFDSTIAAAIPNKVGMKGVSVFFPYYEFRFERAVQEKTAAFLDIDRIELDGTALFPYTPPSIPVRFDEPCVFVTGMRHAETVARFAQQIQAERIYMGHGGDQCFATDLHVKESIVGHFPTSTPFSKRSWQVITRCVNELEASSFRDRLLGTALYDARQDVWVRETFGATIRTPFSDLRVFRSGISWSRWCKQQGIAPNKTILAEAVPQLLPLAVRSRKGKVAYDGVWARAYRQQAIWIAHVFESVREVFGKIGVSTDWLQRRALDLGLWKNRSDRELLAFYAIATWLSAWGLTATDMNWAD